MKLAVLYSGGKDSNYALYLAQKEHDIKCLITMDSINDNSYMFQKPGNEWISLQAECLELPLIRVQTKGEKEKELKDLKAAIIQAIRDHGIEGIVTGAIKSVYQASRVQKICYELGIHCFNPLWQINEEEFLDELIRNNFEIKIIGIASYPFSEAELGKSIDSDAKDWLLGIRDQYSVSLIGEGGEFESFVLDSPTFKKRIEFVEVEKEMDSTNSGVLLIKQAKVIQK